MSLPLVFPMSEIAWLLTLLEESRKAFEEGRYLSHDRMKVAFKRWNDLILEDEASLLRRSSARRSIRRRARALLRDIYQAQGPDVFLLCTLATSATRLATVDPKGITTSVEGWWNTVVHPNSLSAAARRICGEFSIRDRLKVDGDSSQYIQQTAFESSRQASSDVTSQTITEEALQPSDMRQSSVRINTGNMTATELDQTVQEFDLVELLGFLQQQTVASPARKKLRMVCPWNGIPLPSVEIDLGAGMVAKTEFSQGFIVNFIKYMLASRARPENPD